MLLSFQSYYDRKNVTEKTKIMKLNNLKLSVELTDSQLNYIQTCILLRENNLFTQIPFLFPVSDVEKAFTAIKFQLLWFHQDPEINY